MRNASSMPALYYFFIYNMEAKIRAKELFDEMFVNIRTGKIEVDKKLATSCAIVAVDNILNTLEDFNNAVWEPPFTYTYWISVRKHLTNEE